MEGLLFLVILIGGSVLFAMTISGIMNFCCDYTDKKRHKEHPEFFKLTELCHNAGVEECHWYNEHIYPLKNKVDAILREWNYYTTEMKVQKEVELEELRKDIQIAETTHKVLHETTEAFRKEAHDYVEKHDLKWARNWGW